MTDNQGVTPPYLQNLGNMTTTPQLKEEIDNLWVDMGSDLGEAYATGSGSFDFANYTKRVEAIITAQVRAARIKSVQFDFDERELGGLTPLGKARGAVMVKFADDTAAGLPCDRDTLGATIAKIVNTKLEGEQ